MGSWLQGRCAYAVRSATIAAKLFVKKYDSIDDLQVTRTSNPNSENRLSKERVRLTSAALAILGRADSLIPDDSMMEKYRKLIKRQRAEKTEESADSRARIPSLDQASQPIKSPEAPVEEQASDETAEVPSSLERWEPLNVYPSNSSTYSQWQQELREIEWEIENEVWESCPYD